MGLWQLLSSSILQVQSPHHLQPWVLYEWSLLILKLMASDEATLREFDPRTLQGSTQERMPTSTSETLQCAQVVGVYDAAQHGTYESLKAYAAGRYDITGGFEPPERYYLMVYSRYLEYATWRLVDGLRDQETTRLARIQEKSSAQK